MVVDQEKAYFDAIKDLLGSEQQNIVVYKTTIFDPKDKMSRSISLDMKIDDFQCQLEIGFFDSKTRL